jgi:CBS domain containing-hemolysin-like protein
MFVIKFDDSNSIERIPISNLNDNFIGFIYKKKLVTKEIFISFDF